MKRTLLALLAATTVVAAVPAVASAQVGAAINERQVVLDARIDAGVKSGQLTREEAARLRADFNTIARLEGEYRAGGLTPAERADLDRRFDVLNGRITASRSDADSSPNTWQNINTRQARLDERIDRAQRNGNLSSAEASSLRSEFQAIARLEAQYRAGGLTPAERADLDSRFDRLNSRIRDEARDS